MISPGILITESEALKRFTYPSGTISRRVVIRDVSPWTTVVGVPGRIAGPEKYTRRNNIRDNTMPNPILILLRRLQERQQVLEDIRDLSTI